MFDLVIVGGGPAGATLARLTAAKLRVLVLERRELDREFTGGYEKCCGGLLAPDAQEMLARLGLGVPKSVLVGPQLFTVRTMDFSSGQERYYQRDYVNVDREAFDRWLVSLLPDNVDGAWGALFRSFAMEDEGIRVTYLQDGQEKTVFTKLLVGADGACSRVRKLLGDGGKAPDMYVSIQEWFKVERTLPYYSAIFDPEVTDFYSWTIPKEDMLLVGTAIPALMDASAGFELLKQRLAQRGFDLSRSVKKRGIQLFRPSKVGQICTGRGDVALVGEAAGWISPSSAEGFSYGFRSALNLALALEQGCEGGVMRYNRCSQRLRLNILGKIIKSPAMYYRHLRRLAMGSGYKAMKIY